MKTLLASPSQMLGRFGHVTKIGRQHRQGLLAVFSLSTNWARIEMVGLGL
jgi:hypothetical protein